MKLKPFDINEAKNWAKVVTRDGRPVRILCCDRKSNRPIIALVDEGTTEECHTYPADGRENIDSSPSKDDLMLVEQPWRALFGEYYYIVGSTGAVLEINETFSTEDYDNYDFGNYFRTREEAENAASEIRKTLEKLR